MAASGALVSMIVRIRKCVLGLESSCETGRRAIKLARRIGRRTLIMLVHLGLIGDYVAAQECTLRSLTTHATNDGYEELKMVCGSINRL